MKIIKSIFVICCLCLVSTGCFNSKEKDIVTIFKDKVQKADKYYLEGNLEIINNEESYNYDVKVSYKDENLFKVSLTNKVNDHEQIILKNEDGVYVLTPSLNKSFKFQSDWPYNNSQSYLLQVLLDDIESDKNMAIEENDGEYIVTTKVNYSNNNTLEKQKIYMDKKGMVNKVEVLNKEGKIKIKMVFDSINFKKDFDDSYFELDNNINYQDGEKEKNNAQNKTEQTSLSEELLYPMYLPDNTHLTDQQVIDLEDGERVILTFSGDDSFMLIEETINVEDEFTTIPVFGDIAWTGDTLGSITENTVTWMSNGVEYYIVSDTMDTTKLLQVANSISSIPIGK